MRRTLAAVLAVLTAAAAWSSSERQASAQIAVPSVSVVASPAKVPATARALGALPASATLSFEIVLRSRDQAGLESYLQQVSSPGSPRFRQFLTAGQFADRFGPAPLAVSAVSASLQRLGLHVDASSDGVLDVSANAGQLSTALHTSFSRYQLQSGRVAYANTSAAKLPVDVASSVVGVVGLDDLIQASHATVTPEAIPASGTACPSPGTAAMGPYRADQVAAYYGLTSAYANNDFGAGVNVAVVELETYSSSDITTYESCYGSSARFSTIAVVPGADAGTDASAEATLDIEDIAGLATRSTITSYQAPNTLSNLLKVLQRIASDDSAQVVSTSWGLCEPDLPVGFAAAERTVFEQMAAQGQSVFAASGDLGSEGCGADAGLAVDDPASQPEVTGVGGTALSSPTGPEYVWNGFGNASGGGVSRVWSMPSWQRGVGVIAGSSGTPCHAATGGYCREVPDVSASADPYFGYAIFLSGKWIPLGGTSGAAPTWAAMVALVDASCTGNRLGLINPVLYALQAQGVAAYHDVSGGSNDLNGGSSYLAVSGYDMVTGLGTPDGATLMSDLCGSVVTAQPASVHVSASQTVTFTSIAPAPAGFADGVVSLTVPAGWSAPSTTPTAAGYTTASTGTVSVSGSTLTVSGITLDAGETLTIHYGDSSGGGPGAVAPSTAQVSSFAAQWRAGATGTLVSVINPPHVSVYGLAADGSGTMQVSTGLSIAGSTNYVGAASTATLTFTYGPGALSYLANGNVAVDIPADWTAPTTSGSAGKVTSSAGHVTITGRRVDVGQLNLDAGDSLTITYASAKAPNAVEVSTFAASMAMGGGALVALSASPSVLVSVTPDGEGSMALTGTAYASQPTTLTFTYSPYSGSGQVDGEIDVAIPHDWTPPQVASSTHAGYVTASTGTVSVSNTWTIRVTNVALAIGGQLSIVYGADAASGGAAIAPPTHETSSFPTSQTSTAGGTPVALYTTPSLRVLQLAQSGAGSMTVDKSWVTEGTKTWLDFDYALQSGGVINGVLTIDLPAGWSPPSIDSTDPGYTTTSIGTLVISPDHPQRIEVTGLNFESGGGLFIYYGSHSFSNGTAQVPATTGAAVFNTSMSNNGGASVSLASSPSVEVLAPAHDGTGRLSTSQSVVTPGSPTTITFTYTPDTGTSVVNGELDITVPSGWTAPNWTDEIAPGYVSSTGTTRVGTDGRTIEVGFTAGPASPLVVTYADATPPAAGGSSVFTARMANAGGTPTELAASPTINVTASSGGGSGGGGTTGAGGGGGTTTGGAGAPIGPPQLQRIAGADRIATAVAVSQTGFPKDNSARVVVLARADSFADALAGTPLAAREGGPLLLTNSAQLDARVRAEIERVLPRGATVYLLGGTSALSVRIADAMTGDGYAVQRLAGDDRYGTAVAVAAALGDPGTIFEASGISFPDALSAGTAAAREGAAILLTAGAAMPPATAQYLGLHPSDARIAVGGPAASADPTAQAYRGADRYATSLLMATTFFPNPTAVGLASGAAFPDALAGGVMTAIGGGLMLLVPPTGALSIQTETYLRAAAGSASSLWLFGGPSSVDAGVFDQINGATSGS